MPKINDSLNDAFGLPNSRSIEAKVITPDEILPATIEDDEVVNVEKEMDFQLARKNMKDLLATGQDALDGALSLAKDSEEPRAYEVTGQILKIMIEMNKDLLGLHKQSKDIDGTKGGGGTPHSVTNNMFVGSTKDLQDMVKQKKISDNDSGST